MPGHDVVALGVRGLLLDGEHAAGVVELDDAVARGVTDLVGEDQRALDVDVFGQVRAEARAVEQVVAEDERALVAVEEPLAQDERLGESVGAVLDHVGDGKSQVRPVAEQSAERVLVVGRRDEQDLAQAREHQRAQRVVDHRLVVDRQQLLGDRAGDRVKARAVAASQNDSLHSISV